MTFSVSPVLRVSVESAVASDLPKLVEGLKHLAKTDPMVVCTVEESGQHVISTTGFSHLEICLTAITNFLDRADYWSSEPLVSIRETLLERSSRTVTITSQNKHKKLCMQARPLEDSLAQAIDEGSIGPRDDLKVRSEILSEGTRSWLVSSGHIKKVPCVRGICFELSDASAHSDSIQRGSDQIIPTARRAFCAAQLTAKPWLMEPIYLAEIQAPEQALGRVYRTEL
ncbi:Elongation factor [Thalictrum thalictroides]|uniref:Elongation factor n=1 Tax=Thalictrum thalictroides TaxID=46969 RepID=A0A7J6W427_THATH|nr:Elongation factor [Thalictrum thalictroides]